MKTEYRIKVDATGEIQTFDRLEDCAGWAVMVRNTYCDNSMTFTVHKITTEEIPFKL